MNAGTERDDWAADALNDRDDQAAWEASRNLDLGLPPGWVSRAEMVAAWADERARVEADAHVAHIKELAQRKGAA